jgi:hypothetical protein
MGTDVFGNGPSATHTGTGILEPVIITYFFTYLILFCLDVAEFWGLAFTVATLATTTLNATIGVSAKLIISFIFMLHIHPALLRYHGPIARFCDATGDVSITPSSE